MIIQDVEGVVVGDTGTPCQSRDIPEGRWLWVTYAGAVENKEEAKSSGEK